MTNKHHVWRIKRIYFEELRAGRKKLEIRVGYPWVKSVHQGDTISFENYGENCFRVNRVAIYVNFKEMLEAENVAEVLPGMTFNEALETLRNIYPKVKEGKGVYVFELQYLPHGSGYARRT